MLNRSLVLNEREILAASTLISFRGFIAHFFKAVYGLTFVFNEHHDQIIDALVRVVSGQTRRLLINVPPRYGKTEIAVKLFIAWCLANNPRAKFIHLSYSDDLALDNSSAVRDIIRHEEFQRLYRTALRADSDSKKKWYTEQGGGLYATAAGGAITGFGAGLVKRYWALPDYPASGFGGAIVIDDPLKPDDAFSDTMRGRVNRRFNNTIASRVNSPETPIIVIMQRLHEDDVTGFLANGGSGEEWEHLILPAITPCGKALWPEKHTIERLREMERADGYTFAGQYMQRPSPLGGGIIKGKWFGDGYKALPNIEYRAIFADTAQKTGERNDYSVFECWGKGADGSVYLLDMIRGKWEAPELKRMAVSFWNKHKAVGGIGALRTFYVEDKSSGTGLIQEIKRSEGIPIKGVERTKDKLTRVMDVVGYIEAGRIKLPEDAPFVSDFIRECEAFTADDTHAHDDQIDPMCDAITTMLATGPRGFFS